MRTTVMLPPKLLRAAKARAAERGETLKALLTRALENELGRPGTGAPAPWPLIRSTSRQKKRFTNADLEDLLAADDLGRLTHRR